MLKKQIVSIAFNSPTSLSFLKTATPIFCDNLFPVIRFSFDFIVESSDISDSDEVFPSNVLIPPNIA